MSRSSQSSWALGLGMIAWICLLFSPLAFVQTVRADEVSDYGTVIGIVSPNLPVLFLAPARIAPLLSRLTPSLYRILVLPTLVSV